MWRQLKQSAVCIKVKIIVLMFNPAPQRQTACYISLKMVRRPRGWLAAAAAKRAAQVCTHNLCIAPLTAIEHVQKEGRGSWGEQDSPGEVCAQSPCCTTWQEAPEESSAANSTRTKHLSGPECRSNPWLKKRWSDFHPYQPVCIFQATAALKMDD